MTASLVTLAASALALVAALLVISRIIPDEYDRPLQARQRAQSSDKPIH